MVELGQKLKLYLDLDDSLADTTAHMRQVHAIQYPGIFPPDLYMQEIPDKALQNKFYEAWQGYLRASWLIPHLPIREEDLLAVHSLAKIFSDIDLITARLENQRDAIEELLRKRDLSRSISAVCLRDTVEQEMALVKAKFAKERGTTDAVEDNSLTAAFLAELGIRVTIPDRPWNRRLPNSPNIRKVRSLSDYALELAKYGSPVELFVMHRNKLDDQRNLYEIHRVNRPFKDKI